MCLFFFDSFVCLLRLSFNVANQDLTATAWIIIWGLRLKLQFKSRIFETAMAAVLPVAVGKEAPC